LIRVTYEYICDFCRRDITKTDRFDVLNKHAHPLPQNIHAIANNHACNSCIDIATIAVIDNLTKPRGDE
jgi:hypothetical protein